MITPLASPLLQVLPDQLKVAASSMPLLVDCKPGFSLSVGVLNPVGASGVVAWLRTFNIRPDAITS